MKKQYDIVSKYFIGSLYENLQLGSTRVILRDDDVVITKSEDTENYNFYDFYKDYCEGGYFDQNKIPHIISTGMGTLYNLEKIRYDNYTIQHLNDNGLEIYLQEALILNFGDKKRVVFKEYQIQDADQIFLNSLKSFYELPQDLSTVYSFEFDSISRFALANGLSNVTVFTNEIGVEKILGKNYPNLKFASFNNWSMTYKNDLLDFIDDDSVSENKIHKKMLALSLRYEPHKHLINSYLVNNDENEISWYENRRDWDGNDPPDLNYLNNQLPFDLTSWKTKHPDVWKRIEEGNFLLGQRSPIVLTGEAVLINESGKIPCGTGLKLPLEYHARSFCYIVNETKYGQPFGYFSEKTINSIACMRPFVLVAPPNSLKYLKLLGFKTFDRWWDESYDTESNHEQRILKIFKIIDFIQSKTIIELKQLWNEMRETLQYNKNHIEVARKESKIIYG
jgi:hypothetical protein